MHDLDFARLAAILDETTHAALASGDLAPIRTEALAREDGGAVFSIRRVSSVEAKRRAPRAPSAPGAPRKSPFAPPDPALVLGAIGDAHVALLNKFPVLERHFLIVTRELAPQEELLTERDFAALLPCLAAIPALGFYNGGRDAGASQPHKHLQVVPLPLAPHAGAPIPIAPLLARAQAGRVPAFGFRHALAPAPSGGWSAPVAAAEYRALLTAAGVRTEGALQRDPYNMLVTGDWMLVVARAHEKCDGVSVNALGFAGSFFVGTDAELETVSRRGPLAILHDVSVR